MVQHRLWGSATVRQPQPAPLPGDRPGEKMQDFILYQRLVLTCYQVLHHFVSHLTLIISVTMTDGQIRPQVVRYFRSEVDQF